MADPEAIYNWHRLDGRITTSGQPTEGLAFEASRGQPAASVHVLVLPQP
jgi:hypothetical protein